MSASRPLIVAVTGHRLNQLPEPERPRIQHEIASAIDAAEHAAREATDGPPRCVLHSAIAEGADRYAADAALARGWRLVTPLPFSVERYEEDFADQESKEHYQRLLWASRRILPVSNELVEKVGGGGAAPYAAVGRALIEKADLLLCVWNGLPPKGPGGTSEVAALMLEKGGLVLWIPAQGGKTVLVGPAPLPRAGTFRRKLHEALARTFGRAARPPEMRVA
ncbi:MAG: hypothetical protein K2P58_06550 [Hyphomonadaceae bacterium]|nr:hypothetical protein [Hyphomonadaceae bacterium]